MAKKTLYLRGVSRKLAHKSALASQRQDEYKKVQAEAALVVAKATDVLFKFLDDNDYIDNSCNQCNATMIQKVFAHEVGCPNYGKVKFAKKWFFPDEESDSDEIGYRDCGLW